MQKWEYHVGRCVPGQLDPDGHFRSETRVGADWFLYMGREHGWLPIKDALNHLGGEGWELVGIQELSVSENAVASRYVFKRPKP
jgi:hypothetical protein